MSDWACGSVGYICIMICVDLVCFMASAGADI